MRGIRKQAQHETLVMQRHALWAADTTDFKVGDRVMTVDGFPGKVAEVSYGPFQNTEDYEVVLDNGMGGGTYSSGQLRPMASTTAAVVEASEVYASIPFEAVTDHTANMDYPELENILTDRLPNENIRVFAVNNTDKDDTDDDESDKLNQDQDHIDPEDSNSPPGTDDSAAAEDPDQEDKGTPSNVPDVTPPSACSYCGSSNFEDPSMTGRGTRIRCSDCGGTMKSWGGKWQDDEQGGSGGPQQAQSQWEPEFPNSSQNNASEKGDDRSGGVGGVVQAPGVNFKTTSLQTDAGIIDWVVDKVYNRIQERNENSALSKDWAAPSHVQDFAGPYGTCSQCVAHDAALPDVSLHAHPLTIHSSLDDEWGFHITSSWMDVQAKARKIRRTGGVKIVSASKMYVVGEVQGEHNVYESQLNYVAGTKKVADWACGCKWASYTWGRSPGFKRFEGRLCSHALALQYEAGARGMFGREVGEEAGHAKPVSIQWDKVNDQHLLRSSALLDSDAIYPEANALDLARPPIYAFALNMFENGENIPAVIQMFASFGVDRDLARSMTHEAWAEPVVNEAESNAKRSLAAGWYTDTENGLEDVTAASYVNEQLWDENAKPRDLSDHDAEPAHQTDGKRPRKHRTNDAREHAPHHVEKLPWNTYDHMLCTQCLGSGCGHCAGEGVVPDNDDTPTESLTNKTPDETSDSGPASTSGGVSASLKTADYSVNDPLSGGGGQGYAVPTPHSNSQNPASTGWATGQDPGDWGRSLISNDFGVTFDASLHTTANASSPQEGPTVSGVALKAADTGRVLMIQRSNKDEKDPARGTWEFPGGHHEEGDQTSLHAGIREWQEETGQPFPDGGHVTHVHRSGPYNLHTVVIPEESGIKFHEGRSLDNPDDPDGDDHENAAWWEPNHAKSNPALRKELKGHPVWGDIKKAASAQDEDLSSMSMEDLLAKHKEIKSTYVPGDYGGYGKRKQLVGIEQKIKMLRSQGSLETDDLSLDAVMGVYTEYAEATLHDSPEPALPSTDGAEDEATSILAGNSVDGPHDTDDANHIVAQFMASKGAAAIAGGDKELLAKVAMKDFSHAEQQELINEGQGDRARNFSDLKIAGTHYEKLPDDDSDNLWFL